MFRIFYSIFRLHRGLCSGYICPTFTYRAIISSKGYPGITWVYTSYRRTYARGGRGTLQYVKYIKRPLPIIIEKNTIPAIKIHDRSVINFGDQINIKVKLGIYSGNSSLSYIEIIYVVNIKTD